MQNFWNSLPHCAPHRSITRLQIHLWILQNTWKGDHSSEQNPPITYKNISLSLSLSGLAPKEHLWIDVFFSPIHHPPLSLKKKLHTKVVTALPPSFPPASPCPFPELNNKTSCHLPLLPLRCDYWRHHPRNVPSREWSRWNGRWNRRCIFFWEGGNKKKARRFVSFGVGWFIRKTSTKNKGGHNKCYRIDWLVYDINVKQSTHNEHFGLWLG